MPRYSIEEIDVMVAFRYLASDVEAGTVKDSNQLNHIIIFLLLSSEYINHSEDNTMASKKYYYGADT